MSNQEMQALLAINSLKGWEMVYDEYSPVMYGSIIGLIHNAGLAEEILIQVFLELRDRKVLLMTAPDNWRIRLITYSINAANRQLNKHATEGIISPTWAEKFEFWDRPVVSV